MRKNVYISSADYMTRNTTRRVEVAAPVLDPEIKQRILDIFDTQMNDNVKARDMQPDGIYVRKPSQGVAIDAQSRSYAEAYANAPKPKPEPKPELVNAPVPDQAPVAAAVDIPEKTENAPAADMAEKPADTAPEKKKASGRGSSDYSVVKVKVKKIK